MQRCCYFKPGFLRWAWLCLVTLMEYPQGREKYQEHTITTQQEEGVVLMLVRCGCCVELITGHNVIIPVDRAAPLQLITQQMPQQQKLLYSYMIINVWFSSPSSVWETEKNINVIRICCDIIVWCSSPVCLFYSGAESGVNQSADDISWF